MAQFDFAKVEVLMGLLFREQKTGWMERGTTAG